MLNCSKPSVTSYIRCNSKPLDCVIYRAADVRSDGIMYHYGMADVKTGRYVGEMYGRVMTETMFSGYYPITSAYDSFKIEKLYIKNKRCGYGTKFLKFAELESKALGCEGRVHLLASRLYSPNNPPHLFYRKNNFSSQNTEKMKYFDECIRANKQIDVETADNLEMFLAKYVPKSKIPRWKIYLRFIKKTFRI